MDQAEPAHTGNHIFVAGGEWVFDYHGYSCRAAARLEHSIKRARHSWPGWDAALVELPAEVLIPEERSHRFEGLWLREPRQFLDDALPHARAFSRDFSRPKARELLEEATTLGADSRRRWRYFWTGGLQPPRMMVLGGRPSDACG